jgi:predicted transcriptional regulator
MSISKDNTKICVVFPKELKLELEQLAKEQTRTFSNLMIAVLKDYVSQQKKEKQEIFPKL